MVADTEAENANNRLFGRLLVHIFGWGARNRTRNNSTRNCCVASYTTPHHVPVKACQVYRHAVSTRTRICLAREREQVVEANDAPDRDPNGFLYLFGQRGGTTNRTRARRGDVRSESKLLRH